MQRILVVGGTGFIGLHLVEELLKNKFQVTSISQKRRYIKNKAIFLFLDLSKKIDLIKIGKIKADVIVYAASLNNYDAEIDFIKAYKIGHLALINLLDLKIIKKKLKKIIFLSTAQVYKDYSFKKINLKSEISPKTAYSLSHIQSENYLQYFSKKNKIKATCLRISNGYGDPIINKTNCWSIVANSFCLEAYRKKSITINANPYDYRNFIYVRDISKEIILNIKENQKEYFKIKNIGSNQDWSIKDLANTIKETMKKLYNVNIDIIYKNKKNQKRKIFEYKNNNILKNDNLTSLKKGVLNLLNFIDKNYR